MGRQQHFRHVLGRHGPNSSNGSHCQVAAPFTEHVCVPGLGLTCVTLWSPSSPGKAPPLTSFLLRRGLKAQRG